ncbi:MAG: LysM peptidoglycan-binding domain-containing protein [Caldilineaceae bacterium]|nr:LysM peptidoglycan-binding domain-containing protein [Caldilineaceae bacterium]MBP8107142.1 LysM peptidoglycan-binding domain-containing protein [Caldilineaceae bacterium]MBP8121486.1 LysM peptidoglycan-binding domain-containing protein [Caldilineaceae bacterium]MBP9074084.1 LysM peptidoglycan-binding domain-containing protein [Caldilineaceae bacterium]
MDKNFRRPGRVSGLFLGLLMTFILCFGSVDPLFAASAFDTTTDSIAFDQLGPSAQSVALGINRARANAGLPPLALHPLLNQAAQNHVNDMIATYTFSHTGSDGSNVGMRVARTGYAANGWTGENWVAQGDAANALSWWLNSSIHRANILNPNWTELGIGSGMHPDGWGNIYVAVFSRGSLNQNAGSVPNDPAFVPQAIQPQVQATTNSATGASYVIQGGDTLSAIATRYGLSWQEVAAANGLGEYSVLSLGQVIRLPGVGTSSVTNSTTAQTTVTGAIQYTVQPGDTLLGIALGYGLTWQEVGAANGLTGSSLLQLGQVLRIPTYGSAEAVTVATTYAIQPGDTIIAIAMRYSLDWQHLLEINGFTDTTLLNLGQTIRLN